MEALILLGGMLIFAIVATIVVTHSRKKTAH